MYEDKQVQHEFVDRGEWFSIDDRPRSRVTRPGESPTIFTHDRLSRGNDISSRLLSRFNFYVAAIIANQFNFNSFVVVILLIFENNNVSLESFCEIK